jgi:ribosomal protein L11 methyltransferase
LSYLQLTVTCDSSFSELLIAELSEVGFDGFLEGEDGFEAYAEEGSYDPASVEEIKKKYEQFAPLTFSFSKVEKRNWNEEWEKSFSPIVVEDTCLIRASFHKADRDYPYEIVITPKMSFGTGHHQTTWLMVRNMLHIDHASRKVMDAGCGTAILSILASKLGATEIDAFDIDDWSVENGNENIEVNGCHNIRIQQGTIREVELNAPYDIILANINKNVLLDELGVYAEHLAGNGQLLLSGFFTLDIPDLLAEAGRHGLREVRRDERETWAALLLST